MTGTPLYISIGNAVLSLIVVAGLLWRRRVAACTLLPVYLLAGVTLRVPVWVDADLYTWRYWFFTDLLQTALRLVLAIELSWRVFRALPNGLERIRRLQLLVLLGASVALVMAPAPTGRAAEDGYVYGAMLAAQATYASAWLFATQCAVVWWHGVPTEELHRDVAVGLTAWSIVAGLSPHLTAFDNLLGICSYVLASSIYPGMLLLWARTAWRPDERTALSRSNLVLLRPWRA